jgi:isoprenylcysteine carboxyl methyltransferase (ICMT) family protein YpbQ
VLTTTVMAGIAALLLRLITLAVSTRNERALKHNGAIEFGKPNSIALAVMHAGFYLAALIEGYVHRQDFDTLSAFGGVIWVLSMLALVAVISALGRLWTVKLFIAPDHVWIRQGIYKYVRHPNYVLNIVPELVGLCLLLHAWWTLAIGLPLYLIPLCIRIRQENAAMRSLFAGY